MPRPLFTLVVTVSDPAHLAEFIYGLARIE